MFIVAADLNQFSPHVTGVALFVKQPKRCSCSMYTSIHASARWPTTQALPLPKSAGQSLILVSVRYLRNDQNGVLHPVARQQVSVLTGLSSRTCLSI